MRLFALDVLKLPSLQLTTSYLLETSLPLSKLWTVHCDSTLQMKLWRNKWIKSGPSMRKRRNLEVTLRQYCDIWWVSCHPKRTEFPNVPLTTFTQFPSSILKKKLRKLEILFLRPQTSKRLQWSTRSAWIPYQTRLDCIITCISDETLSCWDKF